MTTASDWLPAALVDRMHRRRGRLHAFERLDPRRTALVVIDLTILFAGDPAEIDAAVAPATAIGHVNRIAAVLRRQGGLVAWVRPAPGAASPLLTDILGPDRRRSMRPLRPMTTRGRPCIRTWMSSPPTCSAARPSTALSSRAPATCHSCWPTGGSTRC